MTDDKTKTTESTNELLSDKQLEQVAGGYSYESKPGTAPLELMVKHANLDQRLYWNKPNEYYVDGKQITRDEAFALYQKLFDEGIFDGYSDARRDTWSWGDERDLNPACMSAAFINGEISGGEYF